MSSFTYFPQQPRLFPPSPSCIAGYPKRHTPSLVSIKKPQGSSVTQEGITYSSGLRTPPAEHDMTTAYHNPVVAGNTYNNHVALARHPNAILSSSRVSGGNHIYDAVSNSHTRPLPYSQPLQQVFPPSLSSQPNSGSTSTQPSPSVLSSRLSSYPTEEAVFKGDSTMVTHSLELPECISPNGGRLDDFAALMTCFFWFETIDTIQAAERIDARRSSDPTLPPLSRHTEPHPAYKKWVHSILTTTQVTQNVVLLALLFVYRLKKTNPRVNGNPGSEYRLLTVALMLGNKFLDDNTYTNKTWAEVSGLSVKEIHVMEVEFLSNMRYGLLTSKEQWDEWLKKLACYYKYCDQARMEEAARQVQAAPIHLSPNHGKFTTPLPSPTAILPTSVQNTPSFAAAYSPASASNPSWESVYQPAVSPLAAKPSLGHPLVRKRSFEGEDLVEPAPKRVSRPPVMTTVHSMRPAPSGPDSVRLPAPQLTLDTSQATLPHYGPAYYPSQSGVSLPPLNPGIRAMSTVYSTPTSSWPAQGPILSTTGPQTPSYTVHSSYGTPTKRQSPIMIPTLGSSPLAEVYSSHTPIANSPSVYLQQRASPYKPVRRVSTLLNPPPSIPLSEYHLGSSQMHYQPLGRRNDLRTGIVPEFLPTYAAQRPQVTQMPQMSQISYHPSGSDPSYIRLSHGIP